MSVLDCDSFTQLLVDQQPVYDELILEDIRPTDTLIGMFETGTYPPHQGVTRRLDRFKHVFPNTTKVWNRVQYASCIGHPCDKTEHCIGWGSERIEYFQEEQYWNTPLLCFDEMLPVTHSEEQFEQIIRDILRPSTSAIMSMFLRKRLLSSCSRLFTMNRNMTPMTFTWTVVGDEEYFLDCSVNPNNVFLLVPQALQVRFNPLMRLGYAGKNPFKETAPWIEMLSSIETAWSLDRLGGSQGVGGVPSVNGNWRFTEWTAADAYWRYGYSGQIGNFQVHTDWANLRFNFVGDLGPGAAPNRYRYQLVIPYTNIVTGGAGGAPGLGSIENPDFDNAQYEFSFITHRRGMQVLTVDSTPINPEMPFSARDFGGRWQFVMDNLGADVNGCVIENKRRNKGQFIADFRLAIRPLYTEFLNGIFHKREPMCVPEVDICHPGNGYPTQIYNSCPEQCPT